MGSSISATCGGEGSTAEMDLEKVKRSKLKKVPVYWILGGPGSGKGTQCKMMVEKYGFTHLSSGDLLRREGESGSDRGNQLNTMMKNGELVPLGIVLDLLAEEMLKSVDTSNGYLIDGYPRDTEQAKAFESEVVPCTAVLYFELSDETMRQRLLKRGETSGRADDNLVTIDRRINTFHSYSEVVAKEYEEKCTKIDAERPPEEIFGDVCQVIDEKQSAHNKS